MKDEIKKIFITAIEACGYTSVYALGSALLSTALHTSKVISIAIVTTTVIHFYKKYILKTKSE